ncbi:hypothetical protein Tco_1316972 [Tanacetum coccineum]
MAPIKTTTPVTDAQLKALIARGFIDALAEIEANKTNRNSDDNHDYGTGSRRTERAARECNYSDFLKCQPLNFKGTEGVVGLTQWMFPEESDEIEKYVGGLPDMIHGSVMASKPKTMQDAVEFATELVDQKIRTLAERLAENKRKLDNKIQAQQQPPKKQGVAIAYTVGSGERKKYAETLPLCNKCKFHHNGQCTVKNQGHCRSDCPELKNQNHGNQAGGT